MNYLNNSVFCTPDITLLSSCIKKAVESCESKCLRNVGREESRKLVADHVVKGVTQIVLDCSGEAHWKDEKQFGLSRAHSWLFLAWMNTSLGWMNTSEKFTPINTMFYFELVRMLEFEKFMVQCLCQVEKRVMKMLTEDVMDCISDCLDEGDECFFIQIIECCLEELHNNMSYSNGIANRLVEMLSIITSRIRNQVLQLKIMKKLAQEVKIIVLEFKKERENDKDCHQKQSKDFGYTIDVFTGKQNFIEFETKVKQFLNDEILKEEVKLTMPVGRSDKKAGSSSIQQKRNDLGGLETTDCVTEFLLNLVCFIQKLITSEWGSLFCWKPELVIESSTKSVCHDALIHIFTLCLLLQRHVKSDKEDDMKKLQAMIDVLDPYFECQATSPEKAIVRGIVNNQGIQAPESEQTVSQGDESLDQELEKAVFRIQENLVGNERSFEWLLKTEELYQDKRWLECVLASAKKFASTPSVKMLLDVLCVLHESALQDTHLRHIYKSLQQVVLDLVPCLSLHEQEEVVIYNFDLICLHFESNSEHSLFILPHDSTPINWTSELLTVTMNKIVNNATGECFSWEVLTGITKCALTAPYATLKALLMEAVKHAGYEKVICQLLQVMPWFAGLHSSEHDPLLVNALNKVLITLPSKKQEGQFLKLIGTLLQPSVHPELGTKEPPLLASPDVMKLLIQPLLTAEENGVVSPTMVLDILLTTLSCSQPSPSQQHWILDQKPFELLFTLLELFQDCIHFWEDWVLDESSAGAQTMERDDFALDEAWTEVNVILKILDEYLIPVLAEAISSDPGSSSMLATQDAWIQNQLSSLDWTSSLLILPLLKDFPVICTIKLPKPFVDLLAVGQLDVLPLSDTECLESFWTVFFKSCALSNEVFGMYLSTLKDNHPLKSEHGSDCEEIIEALAKVLPFSTWSQWQRLSNIAKELLQYGYLSLKEEKWTDCLVGLPEINITDQSSYCMVNVSVLLVSVLRCIASKLWATTYVWSTTLKNYVSEIKQLLLNIAKQDELKVRCHILAHLSYVAFKIIPEGFIDNIAIVMLDLLNACLSSISTVQDENLSHVKYLQDIIATIPQADLRLTMTNKIRRAVSNISE